MFFFFQATVILTTVVIVLRFISNFRKVKSVPGPFLASCTSLWQFCSKRSGRLFKDLDHLHKIHGPLVRYAPNIVSVSDPGSVNVIYGFNPVWKKSESYHPLIGINQGRPVPSIIGIMSEERHTALKRPVAPAFTNKAVLAYEHIVHKTADELVESLSRLGSFDLAQWMQYFTMDVLSRIAFSQSLGFVTKGKDISKTMETIELRFEHWNSWSALAALEWMIFKNPLYTRLLGSTSPLTALAATKLSLRKTGKTQDDLLQKYIEASISHPDVIEDTAIMGLTMSTIAAGADTTAITLGSIIFNLVKNPKTLHKLEMEIEDARNKAGLSNPPKFSEMNKLPYLEAVIKEAMRFWPIFTAPIERVVPRGGLEVAGTFLPEGTVVGCHQKIIQMDRACYGADANLFNPDRWLNASDLTRRQMDRASLWFGSGKHICIGRHIAMLEMKILVPRLLLTFKMTLDDPNAELESKINGLSYLKPIPVTFERI